MKRFKILFCDLDGTLIKKTYKQSDAPWNMEINFDLFAKIKQLMPDYIFIVTNQSKVGKTITEHEFEAKLDYICACISYYIRSDMYEPKEVEAIYCQSDDLDDYYRKPNPGMIDALVKNYKLLDNYTLDDMLMVGDSSGNSNGDADFKTAENFGIFYCDVNDFIKIQKFEQ